MEFRLYLARHTDMEFRLGLARHTDMEFRGGWLRLDKFKIKSDLIPWYCIAMETWQRGTLPKGYPNDRELV